MSRTRTATTALAALASCCVFVASAPHAAASEPSAIGATSPGSAGEWSAIEHPSPPGEEDLPLRGVWTSGKEIWSVGHAYADLFWKPWGVRCTQLSCTQLNLAGPDDSAVATAAAIDGTSTSDVWVVGRQLVKHFDGSAWAAIDTTAIGTVSWSDVDAVSPMDVWAIGTLQTNGPPHTVSAHWDGTNWLADQEPFPASCGEGAEPQIVAAHGTVYASTTCDGRGMVMVRDGGTWLVELDRPARIVGLDLVGGKVWATGSSQASEPRIWRKKFGRWHQSNAPTTLVGTITAMAGRSVADRWVVGAVPFGPEPAWFVAHWDGLSWTQPAQPPDTMMPILYDVTIDAEGRPWAVGGETDGCPHPNCGDLPLLLRGP